MLQFVSNQVGEFPDLFSEPLCGTFQNNNACNGSGTADPSSQKSYSQGQPQSFLSNTASPQIQTVQVKVSQAATPTLTPQRAAPPLQPRPQVQPQLQQQTVMITPTFSSAPQTRFIQQPVIYQNAATSFQGNSQGPQSNIHCMKKVLKITCPCLLIKLKYCTNKQYFEP